MMYKDVTVLLDMDGVLVDFVRGSLRWHGKEGLVPYADLRWDFPQQVGFSGTWAKEFWSPLGYNFWADLEWTPFGRQLLDAVFALVGDNILFTSSPCDTPGCEEGKRAWLAREVPSLARHFNFCKEKHKLSKPYTLLIDDHGPNVDKFQAGKGEALLVPQPWNDRRVELNHAGEPCMAQFVRELGHKLYCANLE